MGLGVIDQSLDSLLTTMENMSPNLHLPDLTVLAKTIGLGIALGVGANECYQMMLGKRGMDVMKLLHIVIISLCISASGAIANMARTPGKYLEGIAKNAANGINESVVKKEEEVAQAQQNYLDEVRKAMRQMEQSMEAEHKADSNWTDYVDGTKIKEALEEGTQHIANIAKEYALVLETKICEWVSLIIRLIGEIILQAIIYGLLVSQRIFMHLLEMVAPIMFAISLSPHFKSAWSQWLSKYISISLWGFVTYVCMFYVFHIILQNLEQDLVAYKTLQSDVTGANAQVAAIGMQAVGSTCMYLVGVLVGIKVLAMVPEAASWLIPGGVSSNAGSSAAGVVVAGTGMAAGGAIAAGGMAAGVSSSALGAVGKAGQVLRNKAWEGASQNNA